MDLNKFKAIMTKDLEKFCKEWEEGMKENPSHYPQELEEGDWFDQFLIYESTKE